MADERFMRHHYGPSGYVPPPSQGESDATMNYIQTPLGLADELKAARKDRQALLHALVAIKHRHKGIFDSMQLRKFGPLTTNTANDMATIAELAYDEVTRKAK